LGDGRGLDRAHWSVVGWTALALAALASEQLGGRSGGRPAALGLALLAFPCLFGFALWDRPSDAASFTDPWALALYAYVAGTALAHVAGTPE